MRTRGMRSIAVATVAALALAGCSGGSGDELPADASPAEVVAAGLGDRFENGAAFTLQLDGDVESLAADGESVPEALTADGAISGAMAPGEDGGFALTIGADGAVEIRAVDETLYLRVDLQQLGDLAGDAAGDIPDPQQLQQMASGMGLPQQVQSVLEAALAGEWVGITGLSQEELEQFANSMGAGTGGSSASEVDQEDMKAALEEQGLSDGDAFTERYLSVEGEGPTYDVTLQMRALVQAFNALAGDLQQAVGPAAGGMLETAPPEDVPETVSGIQVTVEDGSATEIALDLAALASSMGESPEDLAEGDVTVRMQLDDIGDQLAVPDGATTIAFEELVSGGMGGMLGGGMGGLGGGGMPTDLPTEMLTPTG